ncbi:MAG: hypothetical protein N4J56_004259 [Chroococcidiopsis sp. SAG 2025]|nr:hypothetical protein [Chroococcidiopsis sp. SAG 2025]
MHFSSAYAAIAERLASLGVKPQYITELDSATVALRAVAKYLHGKELRSGGIASPLAATFLNTLSQLPRQVINPLTTWAGWLDASSPSVVNSIREETISHWVVSQYPQRNYPAAIIGSTNGAAVHLCAALGIPWLPQTMLSCLRHSVDPDEPRQELEWAKAPVQRLLERNPNLAVYQMHDPNQDRLKDRAIASWWSRLSISSPGGRYTLG